MAETLRGRQSVTNQDVVQISLTDAMQVISPEASNASRWYTQHLDRFRHGSDYVYSDNRYPGKSGRIWITIPTGLESLARECQEAKRLKVPDGVEERIAPFIRASSPDVESTADEHAYHKDVLKEGVGQSYSEGDGEFYAKQPEVGMEEGVRVKVEEVKQPVLNADSDAFTAAGKGEEVEIEFETDGDPAKLLADLTSTKKSRKLCQINNMSKHRKARQVSVSSEPSDVEAKVTLSKESPGVDEVSGAEVETTPEIAFEIAEKWLSQIQLLLTGEMKQKLTDILWNFIDEDSIMQSGLDGVRDNTPEYLIIYVDDIRKLVRRKVMEKYVEQAIESLINLLTGRIGSE